MSWWSSLRNWLDERVSSTRAFDAAAFERVCQDDPGEAIRALRADQREVAEDLEATYRVYRDRLRIFSEQLSGMTPTAANEELQRLRAAQDDLRALIRRMQTAERSTRALEEELHEWSGREGEGGPRHADHPSVRAEVVRSELAARKLRTTRVRNSQQDLRMLEQESAPEFSSTRTMWEEQGDVSERRKVSIPELLAAIAEETHETELWHAVPDPDGDALRQVKRLRELHALLKQADRVGGVIRDRIALAPRMRW